MDQTAIPVPAHAGPVSQTDRHTTLDALRGFALLGILLMNIVGFGFHFSAYDNPTAAGGSTGWNLGAWVAMHILAEGKMRALFSLMFGAGIILMTSRMEARGDVNSADIYYRRNLWLLLFGILHAYLLWLGDILYPYALCSLVLYPFRRMSPKRLLIIAGVVVALTAGGNIGMAFKTRSTIEQAQQALAAERLGKALTDEQKTAKEEWEKMRKEYQPAREDLEKDAKAWRGGFFSSLKARAAVVGMFHSMPFYNPFSLDIWSMMIAGMAFLKLGILTGERSYRFYAWAAAIGYLIGIPVNSITAWLRVDSGFDIVTRFFTGASYDIGRLSIALAHMSVIMLLCKAGWFKPLTSMLAATGQMALTNYVMHSVICSTLFCGYGFGLYGRLERIDLYLIVAGIWVFQMIASPIWLRYFQFGPLEWGWRALTYWKRPSFRRVPALQDAVTSEAMA
ncbi:MAG: DUF418 domain-containing protein [Bryobacteraceae bacterium]|nr:DUF418 domain-containing protein [Bryobacteraceae bacterium]